MKKLKLFLFLLVATLGSWSCSKTRTPILTATFESDSVNGLPSKDLVGAPSGDSIVYHDAMHVQLSVQNSTLSGSKALYFAMIPTDGLPPGASNLLSFKGIGTDLTQTLRFSIIGQNNGAAVTIEVSDGHGHPMAEIEIGGAGDVHDSKAGRIGNVGLDPHVIVFTMFPSSLEYNVGIMNASGTIITENQPMITDNPLSFSNPAHPMVSFVKTTFMVFGGSYAIGSINISREEP